MVNNTTLNGDGSEGFAGSYRIIAMCVVIVALALLIVAGNLLVLLAVASNRRLRSVTSAFIASLAFGDLLIGVLVIPLIVISNTYGQSRQDLQYCLVTISVTVTLMFNSVANIGAVSLDRYLAIVAPLRYKAMMTRRFASVVIASVWTFSVLYGFVPFMGWRRIKTPKRKGLYCQVPFNLDRYYIITTCVLALFPTFFMLTAYCRIFRVAHRHSMRIACVVNSVVQRQTRSKLSLLKETKAAKMVAIVLGSFLLCWCPLFVVMIVDIATDNSVDSYVYAGSVMFATINSVLNPAIYAALNKEFRSTFRRLLQCRLPTRVEALQINVIADKARQLGGKKAKDFQLRAISGGNKTPEREPWPRDTRSRSE